MEKSHQLANRFREVFLNGTWIANTNYKHKLSDITWQQSTTKIWSLNTIAALTYHMYYYVAGVLQVFDGSDLSIRDKYSFDIPAMASPEDWQDLLDKLWDAAEKFAIHINNMPDEQLDDVFVNEKYGTYRRNIEGMIEHAYYHLGQISLIKKMLLENKIPPSIDGGNEE